MRFSVESRVPFLDYRLVEATLNLPSNLIIKNADTKYILRESMQSILPEEIRIRTDKQGFSNPRREWFKNKKFRILIYDILNSSEFKNMGYFDVKDSLLKYERHLKNKK